MGQKLCSPLVNGWTSDLGMKSQYPPVLKRVSEYSPISRWFSYTIYTCIYTYIYNSHGPWVHKDFPKLGHPRCFAGTLQLFSQIDLLIRIFKQNQGKIVLKKTKSRFKRQKMTSWPMKKSRRKIDAIWCISWSLGCVEKIHRGPRFGASSFRDPRVAGCKTLIAQWICKNSWDWWMFIPPSMVTWMCGT